MRFTGHLYSPAGAIDRCQFAHTLLGIRLDAEMEIREYP
jgi:hypothetical protein